MKELVAAAQQKKAQVFFSTNDLGYYKKIFNDRGINVQVFSTDFTLVKSAARTNPTFYILKNGTVINKYSHKKIDQLIGDLKKQ